MSPLTSYSPLSKLIYKLYIFNISIFFFKKRKTNAGVPKNKLKAEKIDDFDWDSLAFDDGSEAKKETK